MYKTLKLNETAEHKVFFTSDPHFYHDKKFVFQPRGFEDVEDMNANQIAAWNRNVRPTDTVVVIGDFLVGAGVESQQACEKVLNQLNGNIIYLWGNHNAGMKQIYKDEVLKNFIHVSESEFDEGEFEVYPVRRKTKNGTLTFRGHYGLVKVKLLNGRSAIFFCSHYAHRLWFDSHRGQVNHLCGHSHGSDPESQPNHPSPKRLDVGVDNFGGPVSAEKALELCKKKHAVIIDHHNPSISPS
jgi:calcineurin-like phosphoesterase family protein